jgi:hypothetical protein
MASITSMTSMASIESSTSNILTKQEILDIYEINYDMSDTDLILLKDLLNDDILNIIQYNTNIELDEFKNIIEKNSYTKSQIVQSMKKIHDLSEIFLNKSDKLVTSAETFVKNEKTFKSLMNNKTFNYDENPDLFDKFTKAISTSSAAAIKLSIESEIYSSICIKLSHVTVKYSKIFKHVYVNTINNENEKLVIE